MIGSIVHDSGCVGFELLILEGEGERERESESERSSALFQPNTS